MNGKIFIPRRRCRWSKRQLCRAFGKVCADSAARSSPVTASWPDWALLCYSFSPICPGFFFFFLFSAVSTLSTVPAGSAGPSRGISKQPALAVTQGLNAAVCTLFLAPSGAPGCETGIFGCASEGLDLISSPNCCFPFPGPKRIPGAGGSFRFSPMDLAGRRILGTRGSGFAWPLCSEVGAVRLYFFPAKADRSGQNSLGNSEIGLKRV